MLFCVFDHDLLVFLVSVLVFYLGDDFVFGYDFLLFVIAYSGYIEQS